MYIKKAYINIIILNKLLKNKFRVNKLVKYPLKDGSLLQLQLTLFKEFLLSLPKISINVGSTLFNLKNVMIAAPAANGPKPGALLPFPVCR